MTRVGLSSTGRWISRVVPPLALMLVIFWLSSRPHLESGLGAADLVGRKGVHLIEYGLLWWLWLRALGFARPGAAAVVTILFAVSDEWHQSFVDGRTGSPIDVAIDIAGVALAWLAWSRSRLQTA